MRNTLIDAYGYQDANIYMFRDDDITKLPTRSSILYLLTQLVAISSEGDMLWVHYSGHGIQIQEAGLGWQDGILPCDYNTAGIIDQVTLNNIIKNAKCQMMLCFDSCHSGSQCSLEYSINYNGGMLTKTVNNSKSIADTNIVMLSGCQDSQTSSDTYDSMEKQMVGAFTQTLLETLRQNDHNVDLFTLYVKLCTNLKADGFTQIPVLSSSVPSPSFQFARANANGTQLVPYSSSVSGVKATKDFEMNGRYISNSTAKKPLSGLMSSLLG
jgi:hypothetical protein